MLGSDGGILFTEGTPGGYRQKEKREKGEEVPLKKIRLESNTVLFDSSLLQINSSNKFLPWLFAMNKPQTINLWSLKNTICSLEK